MKKEKRKHLDIKSKSQIWIETVVYTLIGLAIISILLTAAMPQIDRMKDKSVIKQTADSMNLLNNKILDTSENLGTIGRIDLKISKGTMEINSTNNKIIYTLENTIYEASQLGEKVPNGDIIVETVKYGKKFNVYLTLDYDSKYNISFSSEDKSKTFTSAPTPYKIFIENLGYDVNEGENRKVNLDFKLG